MITRLRPLTSEDLPFARELSRGAGWNQTRADWERFLELGHGGCFLAEHDGHPAGTATTITYGSDLAWIGMVLVHPAFQRRGIGTDLLKGAIRFLRDERGIPSIRLDATPAGRPLYEGLGFQTEWGLRRWRREAEGGTVDAADDEGTMNLSPESLALDRVVFGADRSELLHSLAAGSIAGRTLPDGSFGFLREGERALYLGPVTAATTDSGLALAESLVWAAPTGREIFWDLPDENTAAAELAASLGFQPVRELTRMYLGDNPLACDPEKIFGLAEPALG
jgi:GNAT superfamily N-acetyltransferase